MFGFLVTVSGSAVPLIVNLALSNELDDMPLTVKYTTEPDLSCASCVEVSSLQLEL